jgi:hypothetical protein
MSEDDVLFGYRLRVFGFRSADERQRGLPGVRGIHRSTYYVWEAASRAARPRDPRQARRGRRPKAAQAA